MRKESIKHENLKRVVNELQSFEDDFPDETFLKLLNELKHSCLIVAGNIKGKLINVVTAKADFGEFGLLFTDMDEFRRAFPNFDVEAHENPFVAYLDMLSKSNLDGFILNIEGDGMILPRVILNIMDDMPSYSFPTEGTYTSEELKSLRDSIKNESLEEFLQNPGNIGKYEELFGKISDSTLLTLMLSTDDLKDRAENGVISTMESEPVGFLYIDEVGGNYATVYTSEEKISSIQTPFHKYSQIVNFSQLAKFVLNDDMDGIIINPSEENVLLTRDVLLEFSPLLEKICDDSRLNSAIYHMFLMDEQKVRISDYDESSSKSKGESYDDFDECWCDEYVPEYDPFDSLDGDHYDF